MGETHTSIHTYAHTHTHIHMRTHTSQSVRTKNCRWGSNAPPMPEQQVDRHFLWCLPSLHVDSSGRATWDFRLSSLKQRQTDRQRTIHRLASEMLMSQTGGQPDIDIWVNYRLSQQVLMSVVSGKKISFTGSVWFVKVTHLLAALNSHFPRGPSLNRCGNTAATICLQ